MANRKSFNLDNEFYCVKCGKRGFGIARRVGKFRESGHLKKLYCIFCKEETNHAECRPWTKYSREDFEFEFNYKNFDEKGNRIMEYGAFRAKMHNEGIELPN